MRIVWTVVMENWSISFSGRFQKQNAYQNHPVASRENPKTNFMQMSENILAIYMLSFGTAHSCTVWYIGYQNKRQNTKTTPWCCYAVKSNKFTIIFAIANDSWVMAWPNHLTSVQVGKVVFAKASTRITAFRSPKSSLISPLWLRRLLRRTPAALSDPCVTSHRDHCVLSRNPPLWRSISIVLRIQTHDPLPLQIVLSNININNKAHSSTIYHHSKMTLENWTDEKINTYIFHSVSHRFKASY